jgi:hypothetical protein
MKGRASYASLHLPFQNPIDLQRRAGARPRKDNHMNIPVNTKPWIQGAIVGAVVAAVIGFSWGGWVTGGSADRRVATADHDATVAALASVCAERFRAQGDATVKIGELSKASTWDRGGVIERSGFAVMPGSKTADSDVARACAESLTNPPTAPKT